MIRHIPNSLTTGNLLCGCIGIICVYTNPEIPSAWFVWLACIFDFLDGFSARVLKVSSLIGKELDSLADMVSFGILPAIVMKKMLSEIDGSIFSWFALLLAICAALRLAKFNIDNRQTDSFIGLPTPAHALFITGIPFSLTTFGLTPFSLPVLYASTGLISWLMVSPFPLFALKFKNFSWASNQLRFTFLAVSVLLLVVFQAAGLPLAILLYVLLSLLFKNAS